ncbi:MAG: TetR/AcrR family transcriptional regulator [Egibacteraceae bacterium]
METRTRILDAALERFARQGYAGTSIRQVAGDVGVQQSAIYNHFAGKQAVFEALVAESGPGPMLELIQGHRPEAIAARPPEVVIPELIDHVITAWDKPRARLFTSVILREGGPGAAGLPEAIADAQHQLGAVFAVWIDAGLLRGGFPAEQVAFELMAPLGMIRLLYLHAAADEGARRTGRDLARRHAEYFLAREVINHD